jgi:hypothetical protein
MSSTLFTTDDGDIILRAGPEPGSTHDFRVHKLILSLASPVFKDMFAFPQPPDQTQNERPHIPIVCITDPPQVLDAILRFIYPGVDLPKFTDLSTLPPLLSAADKYDIASMRPVLRDALKSFIKAQAFRVYIVACRFGLLEEAKAAARAVSTQNLLYSRYDEDLPHVSSTDLFRLVQFALQREHQAWTEIEDFLGLRWGQDDIFPICKHTDEAKDFYFHLGKAVEEAFVNNPCIESKDLLQVLDQIPDPPPGCEAPPLPAQFYYEGGDEDAFSCPFQPMTLRTKLTELAEVLDDLNDRMLNRFFAKGGKSD